MKKKPTLFEKRKRMLWYCLENVIKKHEKPIYLSKGPYRIENPKIQEFFVVRETNIVRKFDNNGFVLVFRYDFEENRLIINERYVSRHLLPDIVRYVISKDINFSLINRTKPYPST